MIAATVRLVSRCFTAVALSASKHIGQRREHLRRFARFDSVTGLFA